ncbi:phage tail protein [Pedobacter psychroterrae]|uniref:Phage tail protein n=1 Tax=Pedobacter psychroterrae TaxID=2530453 RepID=A0A4R0NLR9_9SPHI|nr:phage tail protein [Pedobacter psychroterrae]TCD01770.1 phage tail protein [Pedobacter psychroterrae]
MNLLDPKHVLSHRFGVFFFESGVIPNMMDIRFQKVSGLHAEMTMDSVTEGGENLYTHRIPKRVSYNNLVLERGIVNLSPLSLSFNATFSLFKFSPSNVLVTLFNDKNIPVSAWMFLKAIPVKWSFGDLDANANTVEIETMELSYTRFQTITI